MDESIRDLLVRGMAAAKANEKKEARFYLEWALRLDPPLDQRVEAWYWLSEVCEDPKEKRDCLEEVLAYQPGHQPARRSLAILDGRLDPGEIVDPDHLPDESTVTSGPLQSERFACPRCGGRMVYRPDGSSLTCEYCDRGQPINRRPAPMDARGVFGDFTVAMATALGHTRPVEMRSFECKACGAVFLLSPQVLSLTCPYCASVYVIEATGNRSLIPPDRLIPFSFEKSQAQRLLRAWSIENDLGSEPAGLCGLYLPVWHFSISGRLPYSETDRDENEPPLPYERDLFLLENILVPGSTSLPGVRVDFFQGYDLEEAEAYDPAYLAVWPAETYQVALSDASLRARWQLIERLRKEAGRPSNGSNRPFGLTSMDLLVQSFELILAPAWIAHLDHQGGPLTLVVNGQNGEIHTDRPLLQGWLDGLLSAV